jgi:hypothetical protein
VLSTLPHCNVTIVPYHLGSAPSDTAHLLAPDASAAERKAAKKKAKKPPTVSVADFALPDDRIPIADLEFRQRSRVAGKVYSLRVQPWSGVAALELTLVDDTGAVTIVFFGRRQLPGVTSGTKLVIEGVVGEHRGKMAMLNPAYEIQLDSHTH